MQGEGQAVAAADGLATWRVKVATQLSRGLTLLALPPVLWIAHESFTLGRLWGAAVALGFELSNLVCTFSRLSLTGRSRWLLANLWLSFLLFLPQTGPSAGLGALLVVSVVIAVFLRGPREAVLLLTAFGLCLGLWLLLMVQGSIERPGILLADLGRPLAAGRAALTSFCTGGVALIATSYLLEKLIATLFEAERLLSAQRQEMQAREDEARRRHQVEAELQRSQRVEALGRLAGGVAHDVNNNLTVALASAELIERRSQDDPVTLALCTSLLDAVENAALLTRQLLALGRRDVTRPELVSVDSALARLRPMLPSILGKLRNLTIQIEPDLPKVRVDQRQLEQVILNFVLNARDATPRGGDLTIYAEASDPAPEYRLTSSAHAPSRPVRIHVKDTGTGIAEDVLAQVFEPFFTTKGPDFGTGLGLSVARAFAEASGGRLCVTTREGQGSTFTLELPAAQELPELVRTARQQLPDNGPAATILVVDDDPRIRERIASELRDVGYCVVEAGDGIEALEQTRELARIDLLCTDSVMPRMSGEQLIEQLSARFSELRVLVCSAYVHEAGLRQRLQAGQYAVLPKPFTTLELREAVARALTESRALANQDRAHPAA